MTTDRTPVPLTAEQTAIVQQIIDDWDLTDLERAAFTALLARVTALEQENAELRRLLDALGMCCVDGEWRHEQ